MATLHGFPILVTGRRWCVVEMPDCWAIMDGLDTVPQAAFRFPKDDSGWRDVVAQLQRTDAPTPTNRSIAPVATEPRLRQGRRQFSLARFGIFFSSIILGASAWLPWAIIKGSETGGGNPSDLRGDLFKVLFHGWRSHVAWILVGLAVVCALQALVLPFTRITLISTVIGLVTLVPVIIGITQIHTFTGPDLSHPMVSVGYGVFVAVGGCLLLIMAWAVFPARSRRHRQSPVGIQLEDGGTVRAGTVMEGLTLTMPAPPSRPNRDTAEFGGFPTLGTTLAQLAQHDQPMAAVSPAPEPPAAYPAGWFADYADPTLLRYWDGTQWTEHTHPSKPDQ
jgi:hypothetical protein